MLNKISNWYKNLPDQKKYIEVFTALLSVPVLITVLTLNITNIKSGNEEKEPPTPSEVVVYRNAEDTTSQKPNEITNENIANNPEDTPIAPTANQNESFEECIRSIGPIEIESPKENATISSNPVTISISYDDGAYCTVVWSYRINDGPWSEYDNASIALYDMKPGSKTIEVRAKSLASRQEKTLIRTFEYAGAETEEGTTSEASSSADTY